MNAGPVELRDDGGLEIGPGRRLPLVGDDGNLVPSRQLGQESARIEYKVCYTLIFLVCRVLHNAAFRRPLRLHG